MLRTRFVRSPKVSEPKKLQVAVLLFLASLLSAALLFFGSQAHWGIIAVEVLDDEQQYASGARECHLGPRLDTEQCWWRFGDEGPPIYLLGDSTANMLSDGILIVGERMSRPVAIAGLGLCPPFEVRSNVENCAAFQNTTNSWLLDQDPSTVILTFSDSYFLNYGDSSVSETADYSGLRAFVSKMSNRGHEVIIFLPTPRFVGPQFEYDPDFCTTWEWLADSCRQVAPIAFFEGFQADSREQIAQIASDFSASVVDLRPWLCRDGMCTSHWDEVLVYVDTTHISRTASKEIGILLIESLEVR